MSTLIAPLTTRIQALFTQAAAASDEVEQGLINPPLKNGLQQVRDDFRNQRLHLLLIPASPDLLPVLLGALPKDALPSFLPDPNPMLYSLIPDDYPGAQWNDDPLQDAPPARPIRWIHCYPPRLISQPVCLHILSDPGAVLKSPVLLGEIAGCADLTVWVSRTGMPIAAAAERFKAVPWYAEAMIEWSFTPPPESASGPEGIEDFAAAFRDKLTALLSSPRYDGYLLIAAARKLARLKTLLQYAVQRRQEQIKAWSLEAARRKKGQDDGSKNRVELIGALEKIADDELKKIRQAFVQSYRFYKTAMEQSNSSQGGVRTDHYCYPFSIEGVLLDQVNTHDLEEMQSHRYEPVFKNQLWRTLAAKFGNTEYKLFIKSGTLDSLAETLRKKLKKHLGKECDGFNQVIVELQKTLQGHLERNNLNADLRLSPINLSNLTEALPHSIRVDGDETLVKYGYGQRFREGRMLLTGFSIIITALVGVFCENIKSFFNLERTFNITIWLMLFLLIFSLIIYFPYAGKKYAVEEKKSVESTLGKLRRKLVDASHKLCQNTEEHKKKEFTAHLERIKSQIKAESDRLRAGSAARPPVEGTSELYIARKTEELRQLTAPTAAFSRFNSEADNPAFKSDLQKLKLDLQKA